MQPSLLMMRNYIKLTRNNRKEEKFFFSIILTDNFCWITLKQYWVGERDRDAVNEILLDVRGGGVGGMDLAARWLSCYVRHCLHYLL